MSLSFYAPAPRPSNESARQRSVNASGILQAPPDPALHRLVTRAAKLFEAPKAALTIIDRDRMWFAARVGIAPREMARSVSLCAYAILNPAEPLVIPDAAADERFAGNPFVQSEPGLRFYVGVPVCGPGRFAIGTLCVFDERPREGTLPLVALAKLADRAGQAIADIRESAEGAS